MPGSAIRTRTSGLMTHVAVLPAVAAYTGPGDVVPGAAAWFGLRAYTSASIGSSAIRLRRDSDNGESDFVTVAGGGLDLTSITSFKSAANLFVVKMYDQTGNGNVWTQATAANQAQFTLAGLGSLPIITFVRTSSHFLSNTVFLNQGGPGANLFQPFTSCQVSKHTNSAGDLAFWGEPNGPVLDVNFSSGSDNNTILAYASSGSPDLTFQMSFGSFHTLNFIWDNSSPVASVDGSNASITNSTHLGTRAAFEPMAWGDDTSGVRFFDGQIQELGFWSGAFTGTQLTNMNSNQRAYWGF